MQLLTVIIVDADGEIPDVNNHISITGRHMQSEIFVLLKYDVVENYNAGADSAR